MVFPKCLLCLISLGYATFSASETHWIFFSVHKIRCFLLHLQSKGHSGRIFLSYSHIWVCDFMNIVTTYTGTGDTIFSEVTNWISISEYVTISFFITILTACKNNLRPQTSNKSIVETFYAVILSKRFF